MVEIVDYRDSWPGEFVPVASSLAALLGDAVARIDHIGSTAVPHLCAKDVIDVQVSLHRLDESCADRLEAAGYQRFREVVCDHLPPGADPAPAQWSKFFFTQPVGQRRANIHLREAGRANQRYALLFRDFLRAHPRTAAAYGELKRRLAASLADPRTYPDVKDPAVDLIHFAAEDWAARTAWRLA